MEEETTPKQKRKFRVPKAIRNTLLSIFVLLLLIIGLGVAYTYYVGQTETVPEAPLADDKGDLNEPAIKPTKPSPDAKSSASVSAVMTPVTLGSNASLTVRTVPTAECSIVFEPNKVAYKDSGLVTKIADDYGSVSWAWTIGPNVPLGKWPVKVTCAYNGRPAVVITDIEVIKE